MTYMPHFIFLPLNLSSIWFSDLLMYVSLFLKICTYFVIFLWHSLQTLLICSSWKTKPSCFQDKREATCFLVLLSAAGMSLVQWKMCSVHVWCSFGGLSEPCPVRRHWGDAKMRGIQARGANARSKQGRWFQIHNSLSVGVIRAGTRWMRFC